jgi:hypothetical protein
VPTTTAPAPQPTPQQGEEAFKPRSFPARGDALDEWCKAVTSALSAAQCGDDELRVLAIERLRAFDEARSRLSWDQQKTLAADQNGWAMSSPQACGLQTNEPPSFPLAPGLRGCLLQAGRSRLDYLRAYGTATAAGNAPSPATGGTSTSGTPAPATGATKDAAPTSAPSPVASQPPDAEPPAPASQSATDPLSPVSQSPVDSQTSGAKVNGTATDQAPAPSAQTPAVSHWSRVAEPPTASPHDSRIAALGTVQGIAAAGAGLIASLTVGLWVLLAFLQARRTAQERRRAKADSISASP